MATNNKRPIRPILKPIKKPKYNIVIGLTYICKHIGCLMNESLITPFVVVKRIVKYGDWYYLIKNLKTNQQYLATQFEMGDAKLVIYKPKTTTKVGKTNKPNIDLI